MRWELQECRTLLEEMCTRNNRLLDDNFRLQEQLARIQHRNMEDFARFIQVKSLEPPRLELQRTRGQRKTQEKMADNDSRAERIQTADGATQPEPNLVTADAEAPSCLPECFDISSNADSFDTQMADFASCREDAADTGTCNWKPDDIPSLAAGTHVRLTRGVRVRHRTRESVYAEKGWQGIVVERTYQDWEEYLMVHFKLTRFLGLSRRHLSPKVLIVG